MSGLFLVVAMRPLVEDEDVRFLFGDSLDARDLLVLLAASPARGVAGDEANAGDAQPRDGHLVGVEDVDVGAARDRPRVVRPTFSVRWLALSLARPTLSARWLAMSVARFTLPDCRPAPSVRRPTVSAGRPTLSVERSRFAAVAVTESARP